MSYETKSCYGSCYVWLAEQRSPGLPLGLFFLLLDSFLSLFKTRTKGQLQSLPYVVGWDCFAPGGARDPGWTPAAVALGPNPPRSQVPLKPTSGKASLGPWRVVASGVHQNQLQKSRPRAQTFFTISCDLLRELWSGRRDAAPLGGIAQRTQCGAEPVLATRCTVSAAPSDVRGVLGPG